MYYIVKVRKDELFVWVPKKQGFYQEIVMPYHSEELVKSVWKRLTLRYNKNYIGIVDSDSLLKLKQKCRKWVEKPDNYNVIRGANYNDKGEVRGANYNEKGHTEVGNTGWMKYTKKVYNRFWQLPGEVTVK